MFSRIPYVTFLTLFLRILACSLFRSRVFSRVLLQREYARIRGNIIKCSCVFSRIPYVTFLTLFMRILACSRFCSRVFPRVLIPREYARICRNIIKYSCVFSRIPYVTFLTLFMCVLVYSHVFSRGENTRERARTRENKGPKICRVYSIPVFDVSFKAYAILHTAGCRPRESL